MFLFFLSAFFVGLASGTSPFGLTGSESLMALLALGTLALAYAASVQAIQASEKRREDLSPRLDIRLIQQDISFLPNLSREVQRTALVTKTLSLHLPTGHSLHLEVRNLGTGAARDVKVSACVWWPVGPATSWNASGLIGPVEEPAIGHDVKADRLSLRSGEDQDFEFSVAEPTPGVTWGPGSNIRVLRQFIVTAEGTDVVGRFVQATPIGFYLCQLNPTPGAAVSESLDSLWKTFTNEEAKKHACPDPTVGP